MADTTRVGAAACCPGAAVGADEPEAAPDLAPVGVGAGEETDEPPTGCGSGVQVDVVASEGVVGRGVRVDVAGDVGVGVGVAVEVGRGGG